MENDTIFKNDILKYVVTKKFPLLNYDEKELLSTYILNIVKYICQHHGPYRINENDEIVPDYNRLAYTFINNNYQSIIAILSLLVPYISRQDKCETITKLADIYALDTICNYQYDHATVTKDTDENIPIPYDITFIETNYKFLLNTIRDTSHKLYVNWHTTFPILLVTNNTNKDTIENNITLYNSAIYINSIKKWKDNFNKATQIHKKNTKLNSGTPDPNIKNIIKSNTKDLIDLMVDKKNIHDTELREYYDGINFADIYQTLINEFHEKIASIKWFIYDLFIRSKVTIPAIAVWIKLLPTFFSISDKLYIELGEEYTKKIDNEWSILINAIKWQKTLFSLEYDVLIKLLKNLFNAFEAHVHRRESVLQLVARKLFYYLSKQYETEEEQDEDEEEDSEVMTKDMYNADVIAIMSNVPVSYIYDFFAEGYNKFKKTFYYHHMMRAGSIRLDFKEKYNYVAELKNEFERHVTYKNLFNYAKSFRAIGNYQLNPLHWQSVPEDAKEIIVDRFNFDPNIFRLLPDKEQKKIAEFKDTDADNYTALKQIEIKNNTYTPTWFNISVNLYNIYPQYQYMSEESSYASRCKHMMDIICSLHENGYIIELILTAMIYRGVLTTYLPSSNVSYSKKRYDAQFSSEEYINTIENTYKDGYYYLTDTQYKDTHIFASMKKYNKTKEDQWYLFYSLDLISQLNIYHHLSNQRVVYLSGGTGVGKSVLIPVIVLYSLKLFYTGNTVACTQPRQNPTTRNAERSSENQGVPFSDKYFIDLKSQNIENDVHAYNQIQYKHKTAEHSGRADYFLKYVTDGTLMEEIKKNPILKKGTNNKFTKTNTYDIIMIDEAHERNINMDMLLTLLKYPIHYNNQIRLIIVSATLNADERNYRSYYRFIDDNFLFPLHQDIGPNYNRFYLDRRIDISDPSQALKTRFAITEIYDKITDASNYLENAINKTMKYMNELNTNGDVLLFLPGKNDIIKACEQLNKHTPSYVICLPFYSELPDNEKNFIGNIASELATYTGAKTEELNLILNTQKVPPNTYKKAIIIATDIAEASLTISSLTLVIDTGLVKRNNYNTYTNIAKLELETITYSSQIQRKGRVGRVKPGTYICLADLKKIQSNKPKPQITTALMTNHIAPLFSTANPKLLFSEDPNNYYHFTNNLNNFYYKKNELDFWPVDTQTLIINDFAKEWRGNFIEVIIRQYYFTQYKNMYNYRMPVYNFNYTKQDIIYPRYDTGFSEETLDDRTGIFYIIHPNEHFYLRRPLKGIFYGINEKNTDKLEVRYCKEWNTETPKMSICKKQLQSKLYAIPINQKYIKTNYYDKLTAVEKDYTSIFKLATIFYIYTLIYNIDNVDLLPLTVLLTILEDNGLNDILVLQNTANNDSDLKTLYEYSLNVVNSFGYIDTDEYILHFFNTSSIDISKLSLVDIKKPIKDHRYLYFASYALTKKVTDDINKIDQTKLKQWCLENNYKYKFTKTFVEEYMRIRYECLLTNWNIQRKAIDDKTLLEPMEWLMKNIRPQWLNNKELDINSILKIISLIVYGEQLLYREPTGKVYNINMSGYSSLDNISTYTTKKGTIENTTVRDKNNYLIYLTRTMSGASCLMNITMKNIMEIVPYKYLPNIGNNLESELPKVVNDIRINNNSKYLRKQAQINDTIIATYLRNI